MAIHQDWLLCLLPKHYQGEQHPNLSSDSTAGSHRRQVSPHARPGLSLWNIPLVCSLATSKFLLLITMATAPQGWRNLARTHTGLPQNKIEQRKHGSWAVFLASLQKRHTVVYAKHDRQTTQSTYTRLKQKWAGCVDMWLQFQLSRRLGQKDYSSSRIPSQNHDCHSHKSRGKHSLRSFSEYSASQPVLLLKTSFQLIEPFGMDGAS